MADLSRRAGDALRTLVAAGRIKSAWLPGMRAIERHTGAFDESIRIYDYIWPHRDEHCGAPVGIHHGGNRWPVTMHGPYDPDTDDPLTVFGLLLLAREAWGEPGLYVGTADGWYFTVPDSAAPCGGRVLTGATEAEAIVGALEAAVERAA